MSQLNLTQIAAPEIAGSGGRALHRIPIMARHEVAPRHFRLRLDAPALARCAQPGQFVHAKTQFNALPSSDPLLRRAFSIMDANPDQGNVDVLFRVEGRGTALLATAQSGDVLDLIGPLGIPFDLAAFQTQMFHVKQNNQQPRDLSFARRALVVGGGVGVPPLIFLSKTLKNAGVEVGALVGARSRDEILGESDWQHMGIEAQIATDDGSQGHPGRVTELLHAELKRDARAWFMRVAPGRCCGQWLRCALRSGSRVRSRWKRRCRAESVFATGAWCARASLWPIREAQQQ